MTPSAAVRFGFLAQLAAVVAEEQLARREGVAVGLKNTRRLPSELKSSTGLVGPPVNGPPPASATLTAAMPNASARGVVAVRAPAVAIPNSPPKLFRCRARRSPLRL